MHLGAGHPITLRKQKATDKTVKDFQWAGAEGEAPTWVSLLVQFPHVAPGVTPDSAPWGEMTLHSVCCMILPLSLEHWDPQQTPTGTGDSVSHRQLSAPSRPRPPSVSSLARVDSELAKPFSASVTDALSHSTLSSISRGLGGRGGEVSGPRSLSLCTSQWEPGSLSPSSTVPQGFAIEETRTHSDNPTAMSCRS